MRKVAIEASCKNFVRADIKKNQITTVGQGFSLAQYKAVVGWVEVRNPTKT